jgi:hypothetical protein
MYAQKAIKYYKIINTRLSLHTAYSIYRTEAPEPKQARYTSSQKVLFQAHYTQSRKSPFEVIVLLL